MSQSRDSVSSQSASASRHGSQTRSPGAVVPSVSEVPATTWSDPDPARPRQESHGPDNLSKPREKLPKRRRISRACDDCRRKKIKCDGKQPCSSCAEFNSECTYQIPSRRNKHQPLGPPTPLPRDPRTLEAKLQAAEAIISRYLPHIDLRSLDAQVNSSQISSPQSSSRYEDTRDDTFRSEQESPAEFSSEAQRFIPLIENQDQLRFTESGDFDFHGLSSGVVFLSHFTQHFPELLRYDSRIPFLPQAPRLYVPPVLPGLAASSKYNYAKLPPRELARMLCDYSFNHASCMLRIVHIPSFYRRFDAVYDAQESARDEGDVRYLGLLYSILALGSMYDVDENDPSNPDHYNEAINRGHKFYQGARLYLQDLTECSDVTSLQAILFIIQFLQAVGNVNHCYTLIGVALRSAMRMGLHRHLPNLHTNPIEMEVRKRVFHTIRQMDIYLSTTLGLPVVLHTRDIDQPLPVAVDDEYITEHAIHHPPVGTPSMIEAFNAHDKLMEILASIVECVYSPQPASRNATHGTYLISVSQLKQVEGRLQEWNRELPSSLRPGQDHNVQLLRAQILLRFAYAHVQMMLYRPFMQLFRRSASSDDTRHESYAATGLMVCRNIIHIGVEIRKQPVLIGSYWFILYTQFLAVLCLVFYVFRNPEGPESSAILSDAVLGKESIAGLTQRSLAADRLATVLNSVFEQLPQRLSSRIPDQGSGAPNLPVGHGGEDNMSSSHTLNTANMVSPFPDQHGQWNLAATGMNSSDMPHAGMSNSMFMPGGPIAYTYATGAVSDDIAIHPGSDTMQLVVPDFFGDISGARAFSEWSIFHVPIWALDKPIETCQGLGCMSVSRHDLVYPHMTTLF
ncbi:fungal-specific transcription factor domain-containing protein [Stachybotrys elegans]|uniref:Fungal-specific transcription factor domain-containing protein n=1 Tax=Stachybotrys elegans TaxID=80388 RepID=A0A8K0WUS1_9HYPO|nr:fungal-specific transcription factor domain-containing protein [Stachybotrys elegans]